MTTTLDLLDPMPQNTFQPSVMFNVNRQVVGALLVLVVQDLALTTPPTTDTDDVGKVWIPGTGATGAWDDQDGKIALATGVNLWTFYDPPDFVRAWVLAISATPYNGYYRFDGADWIVDSADGAVAPADLLLAVVNISGAATNATGADHMRKYVRFSHATATFTFNSTDEVFAAGQEYYGRNTGSGTLTLVAAGGMTITSPSGLVIPAKAEFKLKFTAVDAADLMIYAGLPPAPTAVVAPVVSNSTSNLNASNSNNGNYTRFSHASPTYTFNDSATFTVGAEYHGRYVGAGSLMITEAGGMTINPPADGTLEIPPGGTFTVKIVASDEADLLGVTVPA